MAGLEGGVSVRAMTAEDIPGAQRVGQAAWSDMASRELGRKIVYPMRPRRIIEAYLWKEPLGCLVAEHRGEVIGAAYAHSWGKVGWLGPFEVLPELQDHGVGGELLAGCERFLESKGCEVLGLETMCNVPRNVHLYLRARHRPDGASLVLDRRLEEAEAGIAPSSLEEIVGILPEIASLSARGHPLVDYSREVEMAARHGLGAVLVHRSGGKLRGLAVVHSFFPPEESDHASLRLMLVDPRYKRQRESFEGLLAAAQAWSFGQGRRRFFVRMQANSVDLYNQMIERGYRLGSVNMRMSRGRAYRERGRYHLAAWAG